LPNEITLKALYGQESDDPPPEHNTVGDEIDT